ncbi:MAG: ABC transporter substrate-binding protein, partial [Polaromonas sp.]|nr:ABC transporter substrate-binding protein [Polaromonas sp.]
MSDINNNDTGPQFPANEKLDAAATSRRALLKHSSLALVGAGLYGAAPFMGPWKHNHAWAQTGQKKPLTVGLT